MFLGVVFFLVLYSYKLRTKVKDKHSSHFFGEILHIIEYRARVVCQQMSTELQHLGSYIVKCIICL